jgi:hypothetical protein
LSSTEAELIAASVAATDIKFENLLLGELVGDKLLKPSRLYVDNSGAMFIAHNGAVGSRTKHVDIRERYVTEMASQGELEVIYISTDRNTADVLSKNCKKEIHKKHASNLYQGRFPYSSREDVVSTYAKCSVFANLVANKATNWDFTDVGQTAGTEISNGAELGSYSNPTGSQSSDTNDWILVTKNKKSKYARMVNGSSNGGHYAASEVLKMSMKASKTERESKTRKTATMTKMESKVKIGKVIGT